MDVALEYDWSGDATVDTATLRAFIATSIGGEQHPDGTIFRDGMYVMAATVSAADANPAAALFGFEERFRATFRLGNLADPATTDHNTALIVHALIAFSEIHGGRGVLLFNGEENVLQYGPDGIVFAEQWADWRENHEVAPLLTQFASRVLPQPLL
jgi:hypothetical protein